MHGPCHSGGLHASTVHQCMCPFCSVYLKVNFPQVLPVLDDPAKAILKVGAGLVLTVLSNTVSMHHGALLNPEGSEGSSSSQMCMLMHCRCWMQSSQRPRSSK